MTTKQKTLKNLVKKHATGGPPVGNEFTTRDWEKAAGISNSHADKQLKALVASGELTVRKGKVGFKSGNIYKPV